MVGPSSMPLERAVRYAQARAWEMQADTDHAIAASLAIGQRIMLSSAVTQHIQPCKETTSDYYARFRTPAIRVAQQLMYLEGGLTIGRSRSIAFQSQPPPDELPPGLRRVLDFNIKLILAEDIGDPDFIDPSAYSFKYMPGTVKAEFIAGGQEYVRPSSGAPDEIFAATTIMTAFNNAFPEQPTTE